MKLSDLDSAPVAAPSGTNGQKPMKLSDLDRKAIDIRSDVPQPHADKLADPTKAPGTIQQVLNYIASQGGTYDPKTGLTKGGTFDPKTGANKLIGDVLAALESTSGMGSTQTARGVFNKIVKETARPSAAAEFMDAGVKLTPGQISKEKGIIGSLVKTAEDKATSLPVVGTQINAARLNSLLTWNRATANKVMEPLGVVLPKDSQLFGYELIGAVKQEVNAAYEAAHKGVIFAAGKSLESDINNALGAHLSYLAPEDKARLNGIVSNRIMSRLFDKIPVEVPAVTHTENGIRIVDKDAHVEERLIPKKVTGDELQEIRSEIRSASRDLISSESPQNHHIGWALRDVDHELGESIGRTSKTVKEKLQAADKAYAGLIRLEEAAARRAGSGGVFTPMDFLTSVKKSEAGPRNTVFARGDAMLQDWGRSAQKVLPSEVPSSGTTERALLWALLSGQLGGPHALYGLAASTLPYTKPGIAAINTVAQTAPDLSQVAPYLLPGAGALANQLGLK